MTRYKFGELVISTGADALTVLAETKNAGKREAWAKRSEAFFQGRSRRSVPASDREHWRRSDASEHGI